MALSQTGWVLVAPPPVKFATTPVTTRGISSRKDEAGPTCEDDICVFYDPYSLYTCSSAIWPISIAREKWGNRSTCYWNKGLIFFSKMLKTLLEICVLGTIPSSHVLSWCSELSPTLNLNWGINRDCKWLEGGETAPHPPTLPWGEGGLWPT